MDSTTVAPPAQGPRRVLLPRKPPPDERRRSRRFPRLRPRKPPPDVQWVGEEPVCIGAPEGKVDEPKFAMPSAVASYPDSEAWHLLWDDDAWALYVLHWVRQIVDNEAEARVLSLMLWMFNESTAETVGEPRARARAFISVDGNNVRTYATSVRSLAERALLKNGAVWRAIQGLVDKNLVYTAVRHRRLHLWPSPRGVATAYYKVTGDPIAKQEFPDGGGGPREWFETQTRVAAMKPKNRGTEIPHLLHLAVGRHPGVSRLLAQMLWWICDRKGKRRTSCRWCGEIVLVKSWAEWARELYMPEKTVRRHVAKLVDDGLIVRNRRIFKRRWTCCYRPNPEALAERLKLAALEMIDVEQRWKDQGLTKGI